MSFVWTREIRDKILLQLESRQLPFRKYSLCVNEQAPELLGTGAYASVYAAQKRGGSNTQYAVKVVGFGDKHVDSLEFEKVVHMQQHLNILDKNIVRVFEAIQLRVWIGAEDMVLRVQEISSDNQGDTTGDFLDLQFIVMERLQPVLVYDKVGKPQITVKELAAFEEEEIVKLAVNISAALTTAHQRGVLHRDVKLENIFYEERTGRYKLGDFGIAKLTLDGMASTVAFTKGYGAPEVVGSLEEQYDATADVYSFGVVLFVLLNELRFPGAVNYSVNSREQYSPGYVFPRPKGGDDRFVEMVRNMCRFHPDDRYQSMEEVLNETEAVMYQDNIDFRRQHAKTSKVLGFLMLAAGVLLVWQPFFSIQGAKWVVATLILLGAILLYDYILKIDRDPKYTKRFVVGNRYWYFILLMCGLFFMHGLLMNQLGNSKSSAISERLMKTGRYWWCVEWESVKIGLAGSIFSAVWIVREWALIFMHKHILRKKES